MNKVNSTMEVLIVCRCILLLSLLIVSVLWFGLPSYEMYMSKRIIFSEEKIDFDRENPPAMAVAHIPLHPPYNAEKRDTCIFTYNASYEKVTECFNKYLSNLTDIVQSEKVFDDQLTSIGISLLMLLMSKQLIL